MEHLQKLISSFRSGRSVELPTDHQSAYYTLFSHVVRNQHKALNEILSSSNGRRFPINMKNGRGHSTLLHAAANAGSFECMLTLVKNGADPNVADVSGQTPLLIASRARNKKIVRRLLESGADVSIPDRSGITALHWSAGNGSIELIQEIVSTGKVTVDVEDSHLQSPLHMAAMNGQVSSVSKLLELGADINKRTVDGFTPLLNAAKKSQHKVIESLLVRGAEYLPSNSGYSPMDFSIDNKSPHCIRMLLKHRPELLNYLIKRLEDDKLTNEKMIEFSQLIVNALEEDEEMFFYFLDTAVNQCVSRGMELLSQQIDYLSVSTKLIRLISCVCSAVDKLGVQYLLKERGRKGSRGSRKGSDNSNSISPGQVFSKFEGVWSTMESWFHLFQEEISSFESFKEREHEINSPVKEESINEKSPNHLTIAPNLGEITDKRNLLKALQHSTDSTETSAEIALSDTALGSMKEIVLEFADKLCAALHAFAIIYNCIHKLRQSEIRTEMEVSEVAPEVVQFLNQYRQVIRFLVHRNPCIIFEHFSFLLSSRDLINQFLGVVRSQPFDTRKQWFYDNLYNIGNVKPNTSLYSEENSIVIDRQDFFNSSCGAILSFPSDVLKRDINIRFTGEQGMGDGVKREWFNLLSTEFLNPDYALFTPSPDGSAFQPNPNSAINPDHLSYFRFAGKAFGLALYHKHLIPAYFTRSFYKHILARPLDTDDVASIDPEYAKNLKWLLDSDIEEAMLDLTFSVEENAFGDLQLIELRPGGASIPVTNSNKHEYVQLVAEHRMARAIQEQIGHFLEGFHEFIPHGLISLFDETELELLMSGVPDLDVKDWIDNTEYSGLEASNDLVQWFWSYMEQLDKHSLALILQFVSGATRVPIGGFAKLQGSSGPCKFKLTKLSYTSNCLPQAATCFNLLKLPDYPTREELVRSFEVMLKHGTQGFEFS